MEERTPQVVMVTVVRMAAVPAEGIEVVDKVLLQLNSRLMTRPKMMVLSQVSLEVAVAV